MNPLRIYDYLSLARDRVFDAVRLLAQPEYHRQFDIGLKSIASTLTHIMISEWYYVQRLLGKPVPPYDQWPIRYEQPPERFETIERVWREQAKQTRAAIEAERDWNRVIKWLSYPDDAGKRFHIATTSGDLVTQLVLHEVHHRSQVMAMLRQIGRPLQDLDFNEFVYDRIEAGAHAAR
jgi:uncharacterized damage-inducible protein DinB